MNLLFRSFIFSLALLFCSGCGNKWGTTELKPPTTLLSKDQMVRMLADLHLLEAAVNLRNAQNQTSTKKDTLLFSDIFKKEGTTYEVFQENFKYYASQPVVLSKLYDDVLIVLTRKEAEEEKKK